MKKWEWDGYKSSFGAKNDRPGDDGTLRRVIFGSNVKNHI